MTIVRAIYRNGVFRPVGPVTLVDGASVELDVRLPEEPKPWELPADKRTGHWKAFGTLTHKEADELRRITEEEFGKVSL